MEINYSYDKSISTGNQIPVILRCNDDCKLVLFRCENIHFSRRSADMDTTDGLSLSLKFKAIYPVKEGVKEENVS